VSDPVEQAHLIDLARAFESAADDALAAEGEPDPTNPGLDAGR
jgi:hypothetical protein